MFDDLVYKIFLFIVGFVLDVFGTLDTQAVFKKQALRSFFYSLILTLIAYTIFADILLYSDNVWDMRFNVLIYALGGATGGYFTIKWDKLYGS